MRRLALCCLTFPMVVTIIAGRSSPVRAMIGNAKHFGPALSLTSGPQQQRGPTAEDGALLT